MHFVPIWQIMAVFSHYDSFAGEHTPCLTQAQSTKKGCKTTKVDLFYINFPMLLNHSAIQLNHSA